MTIKECYEKFNGDYDGVVSRMQLERLVTKYALKFLDDPTFNELKQSLENKDIELAFRSSHTLKGVAINLGFTNLYQSSSILCEKLRNKDTSDVDQLFDNVQKDYQNVIEAISSLKNQL